MTGVTQLETPRVADPRDYNPIQQNSWALAKFSDIQLHASCFRIEIQPGVPLLGDLLEPGVTNFRFTLNSMGQQARVQMPGSVALGHLSSLPTCSFSTRKVLTPLSQNSTHTTLTPAQQTAPTCSLFDIPRDALPVLGESQLVEA